MEGSNPTARRQWRIGLLALIAAIAFVAVSAPARACAVRRLLHVPAPSYTASLASEPDGASCLSRPPVPGVRASALLSPAHHPAVLAQCGLCFAPPEASSIAARPAGGLPPSRSANKLVLRI